MEPLLILGGVFLAAQHFSKRYEEQYDSDAGSDSDSDSGLFLDHLPQPEGDPNASQLLYNAQGTRMGPGYGNGLQITSPENIQKGTGIPLMKKDGIPSFQVTARDSTRNPFYQPSPNLIDRSAELITNVQNNQAPFPKQNVGRGLGVGADVPAAGGFHQDYRILTQNINENRLTAIPGPGSDMSNRGAPIVKGGALAPGYNSAPGIVAPPDLSKFKLRNIDTPNQGAASGGSYFPPVEDSDFDRSGRSTLKDQTLNTAGGWGLAHSQIPAAQSRGGIVLNDVNRGNANPYVSTGVNQMSYADIGKMTNMTSDNNSIPQGNPDGSKFQQYGPIGAVKMNVFKGNANPNVDFGSIATLSSQNPFTIPSFSSPQ